MSRLLKSCFVALGLFAAGLTASAQVPVGLTEVRTGEKVHYAQVNTDTVNQLLTRMNLKPELRTLENGVQVNFFTIKHRGFTLPLQLEIPKAQDRVYVLANVWSAKKQGEYPAELAIDILKHQTDTVSQFCVYPSGNLNVLIGVDNRMVNSDSMYEAIQRLVNETIDSAGLWEETPEMAAKLKQRQAGSSLIRNTNYDLFDAPAPAPSN